MNPEVALTQGTVILAQQRARTQRSRIQQTEVEVINTTLVESDIARFVPDGLDLRVGGDREASLRRLACVFFC